ncbi:ABC transporter permease [Bifidobacterium sp. H1HS16N]|uniref:ABC transporter permease n=1 Tax=Bifidobacterium kimbladii TaxID=1293826 RepID=A0ABU3KED4_9BIFI|nr:MULTISPECIES: ABC transporter permease [Bifidobacterium]MDT7509120.1 ABC transporter permease [Bifidobacterium sp. H1HS16N]MDT7510753.1 ABC transporter permease [Bifidobacterium sp. H6bp9]MDT7511891.1 ABC transporter permease [Bifidobacterium sp. H1HS10N]
MKGKNVNIAAIWEKVGMPFVLLLLILFMLVKAPNFGTLSNLFNVARAISINAILAAGMTLVIITAGIDLSVGSTIAVSGCVAVLAARSGMNPLIAVSLGIIVGAIAGLVNGLLIAYCNLAAFIVTLGTMTFLRGLAYTITGGLPIVDNNLSFRAIGNGYIWHIPIPFIIMVVVYLVMWVVLDKTRYGAHVYAVGGNPEAARLAGINVKSVLMSVYLIAGLCAGLAGCIFAARVVSAQPTAGNGYEMDAIAATVLGGTSLAGGKGRISGTVIGSVIFGVLTTGLVLMNVPFFTQQLIKGVVIIIAVLIDGMKQNSFSFSFLRRRAASIDA